MTCHEVADFIMRYLDDELPAAERDEFNRHLAICPPCVRYIDSYRKTVGAVKTLAADAPETHTIPEDLVNAILAARAKS